MLKGCFFQPLQEVVELAEVLRRNVQRTTAIIGSGERVNAEADKKERVSKKSAQKFKYWFW